MGKMEKIKKAKHPKACGCNKPLIKYEYNPWYQQGYDDGKIEGKRQEKDIKADHLAGHYIAGKEEAIQIIDNWLKSYSTDIFSEISEPILYSINRTLFDYYDFSLDRLSAHILRDVLIKIKGEIKNGRNK